jgi:hypothetical protein
MTVGNRVATVNMTPPTGGRRVVLADNDAADAPGYMTDRRSP